MTWVYLDWSCPLPIRPWAEGCNQERLPFQEAIRTARKVVRIQVARWKRLGINLPPAQAQEAIADWGRLDAYLRHLTLDTLQ